jgi:lipoyl-dependent peroxiredoxin
VEIEASSIETVCSIDLTDGAIVSSHLQVTASVPGMTKEAFEALILDAKANCPISKLLNCEIKLDYTFEG